MVRWCWGYDIYVVMLYQHLVSLVHRAGCLHAGSRGEDGAAQEADVVATIDVVGPERTVLNMYILQGYVVFSHHWYIMKSSTYLADNLASASVSVPL